jgi:sulfite exporter TauE/SafE
MLTAALTAALALGLLGSLHCALMCGPLAVAGCGVTGSRARPALVYFCGRLVSYTFAGAVFGVLGARAAQILSLDQWQRWALVAVAAAALFKGIRLLTAPAPRLIAIGSIKPKQRPSQLARLVTSLVPRRALPLGLATGALPCGLLAGGWALAAATGNPLSGALLMAAFSLATAPGLLGSLLVAAPLSRIRWSPRWQGALWCALSLWMGLRPFLGHAVHRCH